MQVGKIGIGLMAVCLVAAVSFGASKPQSSLASSNEDKTKLRARMNEMAVSLTRIVAAVYSDDAERMRTLRKDVLKDVNKLSAFSHAIDSKNMKVDDDPSVRFVARRFSKDLELSKFLLEQGELRPARALLRNVTSYCITCHSRQPSGSYEVALNLPEDFVSFSNVEKAEFFAATRQFTEAIKYYEYLLVDKNFSKQYPERWTLAMKRLMAIVIRIKQNASLTMELVSRMRDENVVPKDLDQPTKIWTRTAKEWREQGAGKPKTRSQKLESAIKLISADEASVKSKGSHADDGLVNRLRASNYLHEILAEKNDDKYYGQALYWAGKVTSSLRDINFWNMQDAYFEACIRFQPKTDLAKKCYQAFAQEYEYIFNPTIQKSKQGEAAAAYLNELKKTAGL